MTMHLLMLVLIRILHVIRAVYCHGQCTVQTLQCCHLQLRPAVQQEALTISAMYTHERWIGLLLYKD